MPCRKGNTQPTSLAQFDTAINTDDNHTAPCTSGIPTQEVLTISSVIWCAVDIRLELITLTDEKSMMVLVPFGVNSVTRTAVAFGQEAGG